MVPFSLLLIEKAVKYLNAIRWYGVTRIREVALLPEAEVRKWDKTGRLKLVRKRYSRPFKWWPKRFHTAKTNEK